MNNPPFSRSWVLRLLVLTCLILAPIPARAAPLLTWELTAELPHDPRAYTQGLVFAKGFLWESTGLKGLSSLRKVEARTGRVLDLRPLPREYFGEGLALWNATLVQLTWTSGQAFVYDLKTLAPKGQHPYKGEGWGLATDPTRFIMSNGTDTLTFRSPRDFRVLGQVRVTENGRGIDRLNELEYAEGFVLCNVWHEDQVLVVDPRSGQVAARLDFSALRSRVPAGAETLNGLAWDPEARLLYVTGKLWPRMFVVRIPAWPARRP